MAGGETIHHSHLKTLALAWAQEQGLFIAAPEVSFPHRRFRVDVAACCPVRKVPSRQPSSHVTSILKAAAVFECKQVRSDLIRDNKRRKETAERLKNLESRRLRLENLLHLHLPHLANGETLFPEFDTYRLREHQHAGYGRLIRHIRIAQRGISTGTKFDRLLSYHMANLHYLVAEDALVDSSELPLGWGLLVREGDNLELIVKPTWQTISVEEQLVFLQRIACRKTPAAPMKTRRLKEKALKVSFLEHATCDGRT
jgi:hypothetical protein